jgi:hypothetical protein
LLNHAHELKDGLVRVLFFPRYAAFLVARLELK